MAVTREEEKALMAITERLDLAGKETSDHLFFSDLLLLPIV